MNDSEWKAAACPLLQAAEHLTAAVMHEVYIGHIAAYTEMAPERETTKAEIIDIVGAALDFLGQLQDKLEEVLDIGALPVP